MVDRPDHTVRHLVERCTGCGRSLADQEPNRIERRQVFDLPEPKLKVTEHQAEVKTCACACCNRAGFPSDVTAPAQYGPRVKSVAVYLKYDCKHGLCNGHLLRELIFLWEEQNQPWAHTMVGHLLEIKTAVETARNAGLTSLPSSDLDGFHHLYLHIVDSGYAQNPTTEGPPEPKRRGRRKQSKARNLLDRFRDHPESILAFMYDFDVPFDNNLSERDLRMEKLRQKISGTFRSFAALVDFCRIRSYISTARKNGLTALEALRRIYQGNPFLPTPLIYL
ncbi:MAG: transposase [Verrucomicrobia bacterium]|nr:transposase [Verrucomicrobiota bacterium]